MWRFDGTDPAAIKEESGPIYRRRTRRPLLRRPFGHPPSPLVGREKDLKEVRKLLARPEVRLLTLMGTGRVGKTRLAQKAAREATELFEDDVKPHDLRRTFGTCTRGRTPAS